MRINRRAFFKAGAGALLLSAWKAPVLFSQKAQDVVIPLASFGWSSWEGASGSFSYQPVAQEFEVALTVQDLRPNHLYQVQLITFDPVGSRTVTKVTLSTDAAGKATNKAHTVGLVNAKLPLFQIHVFIVDPDETEPPKAPLQVTGITKGAPLVCLYPAGFRAQS